MEQSDRRGCPTEQHPVDQIAHKISAGVGVDVYRTEYPMPHVLHGDIADHEITNHKKRFQFAYLLLGRILIPIKENYNTIEMNSYLPCERIS